MALLAAAALPVAMLLVQAVGATSVQQAPKQNVSRSEVPSEQPALATSGDSALTVWAERDGLRYALRTAGEWGAPLPVPSAGGDSPALSSAPDGAFDLVWSGFSELHENFEIFHARFSAGRWSLPENLTLSEGQSLEPAIAVRSDGRRMVVWVELDEEEPAIYAATAGSGGAWSSGPLTGAEGLSPDVAVGASWHVAWSETFDGPLAPVVAYTRNDGGSWALPQVMSGEGGSAGEPDLALSADEAPVVAWRQEDRGVLASSAGNGGWSTPARLNGATGGALIGGPSVAAGFADHVHAAWSQGGELATAAELDGQWTAPEVVMAFDGGAARAALVADTLRFLLAAEGIASAGGASDIYVASVEARSPTAATPPTASATATVTVTVAATASGSAPRPSPTPTVDVKVTPTAGASATPTASGSATPHLDWTRIHLPFAVVDRSGP